MKMDPFVRRLVERMLDPSRPLSRNRHFHTFATPEGRKASRIARRLLALEAELKRCREAGGSSQAVRVEREGGEVEVEVRLQRINGAHRARMGMSEFELLRRLPGAGEALAATGLRRE